MAAGPGEEGRAPAANQEVMATQEHHEPELELALLRRGVDERSDEFERCARCHRTPLIGERVYEYQDGKLACELCRHERNVAPVASRIVHGHTIRIIDQRPAA
jgi:hypothetical protein